MPPTYRVSAEHIGTSLPCYLTDHHTRPGECLVGIYPSGQSIDDAAQEGAAEFDDLAPWDSTEEADLLPQDAIRSAIKAGLEGVDLRYIDGNGDRVTVAPGNTECIGCRADSVDNEGDAYCDGCNDGEQAQVWILVTWQRTDT